jgi:hypothetical protein
LAGLKAAAAPAHQQQHRAGKPEQRADDVMRQQALAGQERGEQHDQQRPEIVQESGFRRRRETQREKIQRVIAEQPADADDPRHKRLLQCAEGGWAKQEARESDHRANRKGHGGELERRDFSGRNRQHREQRPHHDRGKANQGGSAGGHWGKTLSVMAGLVPAIHVSRRVF